MHWISLSFLEDFSPCPVTAPLRVQGSPVWNFFHLLTSRVYRVLFCLYDCVSSFVFKFGREASIEGLFWEGTTGVWIALLLPESALIFTFWELREISNTITTLYVAKIKLKRGLVLAPVTGCCRQRWVSGELGGQGDGEVG